MLFTPWTVRRLGSVEVLDALPGRAAAARVGAALTEVVAAEGPVHADRLARLVAAGFGLGRVVESRRVAILRHLPAGLRQDDGEPVVWPPGRTPEEWTGFRRTPEGVERPLEHVPLREIVNAMVATTRASAGMNADELRRSVLAVFGGRRVTPSIGERLDAALHLGVRAGRLAVDGGTISAVPGGPASRPGLTGAGPARRASRQRLVAAGPGWSGGPRAGPGGYGSARPGRG